MQQRGQTSSQRPSAPARRQAGVFVAACSLALAACSSTGGGGDIGAPPSEVDGGAESVDTGPDFAPTPDDASTDGAGGGGGGGGGGGRDGAGGAADGPTTTEFDLAAQPTVPPIEPIPETGVPGIASPDAFCRAWSEFAGSFQALGLTSAVGDPANAFRLEVIAASSVTNGVETMEANLPAELESERVALIADFAGPFFTRALLAEIELEAAGLDPDGLRDTWLATLTEAGVDDPMISIDLPADIDAAAFDTALASFSNAQSAIVDDPTLVTTASIPATETYLADVCPDGGTLAGNDVIGS